MSNACLTPAEQEMVRAYDERTRKAIATAEHPATLPDWVQDLHEALRKSRVDGLRDLQEDIAVLCAVRERFPDNSEIQARVRQIITLERWDIEALTDEIKNARH